jgi:Uma2 family endonuclease
MSTTRSVLKLGKSDEGRLVSSEEFAEADFDEPWKYEREDGRLIVMSPSGGGHLRATIPWRNRLIVYEETHPGVIEMIAIEAWIRVHDGTDRIGDIGVYLVCEGPQPDVPDRIPDMMFEIVSPDKASRNRDYVRKRTEYHLLGVREYVIIDRFKRAVTVLTLEADGYAERILGVGDDYESPLLPGLVISIMNVF